MPPFCFYMGDLNRTSLGVMWNDEDNNPYGSFERRDSDLGSPTSRFQRPATPPSDDESQHSQAVADLPQDTNGENGGNDEEALAAGSGQIQKKNSYESRIERLLYEHPNLHIQITNAGKNMEGGGNYIDIEVRRRYSDFYSLRSTLVSLHPTLIIPPIPEKHSMADYAAKPTKAKEDEAIIEHRKRMLTSFLNRCKRQQDILDDGVFWKFLDPHASWVRMLNGSAGFGGANHSQSEILRSAPIISIPKNNLRAPPLDASNPTSGHQYLPIPSSTAKLKSAGKEQTSLGTPASGPPTGSLPSTAAHTPIPGPQIFGRFPPPSTTQLSEAELDPYFVNFEATSRELEHLLQGNVDKVNKRMLSHFHSYADDLAELGARFNGFSLSEQSPSLAAAIEKVGQAVDSTYMATSDLSANLSAGFSEPMRESAQFAGIVRSVLRYRILKRVQEEMTRDELDKKRALIEQLERSEVEAKRIDAHLESSGFLPERGAPKRSFSTGSTRSDRSRNASEADNDSIDSDFASTTQSRPPSSRASTSPQPKSEHRKTISGNFVTNKIFGRLSHTFQGMVDVDPERTRRDQMGKTKESLSQLEMALEVSEKDVKDASRGVLKSLQGFQKEKEEDLRTCMISYARSHVEWARKNLTSWEEAKAEADAIHIQA
ncbi:MAG: hypothetical protein Q9162_001495 [Coniocarpon cinnabarinum]